jgi:hypothetical protein
MRPRHDQQQIAIGQQAKGPELVAHGQDVGV